MDAAKRSPSPTPGTPVSTKYAGCSPGLRLSLPWAGGVALLPCFIPNIAQAFKPRTNSSESYAMVHLCFSEYELWLLPSPSSTVLVLLAIYPSSEYAKARTKMAMNKRMRSKRLI
jgi:hypothetical protein